jgi:hypothetical protein
MEGSVHRLTRFAAALAVMAVAIGASASATVPTQRDAKDASSTTGGDLRVLTAISGAELNRILDDAGYAGGTLDADGDILVKIEDRSVYFLIAPNKESIQAKVAWKTSNATRPSSDTINSWNRSRKYSKAYFDANRDPYLALDLDLAGGVTVARVKDFARTVHVSVSTFASEVLR